MEHVTGLIRIEDHSSAEGNPHAGLGDRSRSSQKTDLFNMKPWGSGSLTGERGDPFERGRFGGLGAARSLFRNDLWDAFSDGKETEGCHGRGDGRGSVPGSVSCSLLSHGLAGCRLDDVNTRN